MGKDFSIVKNGQSRKAFSDIYASDMNRKGVGPEGNYIISSEDVSN